MLTTILDCFVCPYKDLERTKCFSVDDAVSALAQVFIQRSNILQAPCWDSTEIILEKQKQRLKLPLVSHLPCTTTNIEAFSPQYMPPYGNGEDSAAWVLQQQLDEQSETSGTMSSQEASSVAIRAHWGAGKSKLIRILNRYVDVSLASGPTLPQLQVILINGSKKLRYLVDAAAPFFQDQFALYYKFHFTSVRLIKVFFMAHILCLRDFIAAVKSTSIPKDRYKEAFLRFNGNEAGTTLNQKHFFELMPHAETEQAYLELSVRCREVIDEIGRQNFFFVVEEFGTLESSRLLEGLFFPAKSLDSYCKQITKLTAPEQSQLQLNLLQCLPSFAKGFSYIFETAFVEFLAAMKISSALTSTVNSSGDMEPLGSPLTALTAKPLYNLSSSKVDLPCIVLKTLTLHF